MDAAADAPVEDEAFRAAARALLAAHAGPYRHDAPKRHQFEAPLRTGDDRGRQDAPKRHQFGGAR